MARKPFYRAIAWAVCGAFALGALVAAPRSAYARSYSQSELRSVETPSETQVRQIRDEEENQIRIALGRLSTRHRRADMFLRLAEIYMEAYHAEFLLEGRVHDKRLAAGMHDAYIDRAHSKVYLGDGIRACQSILKDELHYDKLDEVYYFLAFNYGELGDKSLSLKYFRLLVDNYPNSPMISEAYDELGDAAYAKLQFREAQREYSLAAQRAPVDTRPEILHKLAWSFYRTKDFDQAVQTMKQAITLTNQNGQKFLNLREEALRDIAVFMTEGDRVDEAIDYFKDVAGDKSYYPKLLEKLGDEYEHNVQSAKAIAVYRALLKTNPDDETRFRVMAELVELDIKSGHYREALSEVQQIADNGGVPSGGDTETQVAGQNLRAVVRHTATEAHRQYRKDGDRTALVIAEQFYRAYLDDFLKRNDPHHEMAEIQMYLAEVERDLGNSRAASELYREVVQSGDSRYAKQAGGLWTASLSEAIRKQATAGARNTHASEPSAIEKEYIDAADQLQESLGNSQEGREAALKAAEVEAGYPSTRSSAIHRARKLIKMAPNSAEALTAARLWLQLESDQFTKDHQDSSATGDLKDAISDLSGNSGLMSADQSAGKGKLHAMLAEQRTRLRVSSIADNEKDKDYGAAAKGYESFAHDSQSRDLAEKAYASALADYVKASDQDSANRVSVEWLTRFPGSSKAMGALRGVATQYLISGDFSTAAKEFKRVGETGNDAASLETAALINNGIGDSMSAQIGWGEYLSRYPGASERANVILALAKSYEAQNDDSNAAKYYKLCMDISEVEAECGARLGDLYVKGQDWDSADGVYRRVAAISGHSRRHREALSPYVGYARFKLARKMEQDAHFPPLALPASALKSAIAQRTAFLRPLSRAYMNAVEAGGPWAVAALDSLAEWATHFADEVDAIAPPAGSTPDAAAQFRKSLKALSGPLRNKAVSTWSQAYEKAAEAQALSPALPEIADHLADSGADTPMRAQGVHGEFRLAGIPADGGSDGRDTALAKVRARLTKNAQDAQAWIDYGNLLWGSGKPLLAKILYEYALTLSPGNTAALNNRGVVAASQNEEDWVSASEAAQFFRQALEQDEFFVPAKMNLALLMNYYRLFSKAKSYWMQVRTRVQNGADVEDGYAIALQGTGDLTDAKAEFAKATELGADSDRFANIFHQAARQSFDRSHLSLAGQNCLGKLEGIHEDALAGFEKSAIERLKRACTEWAGQSQ